MTTEEDKKLVRINHGLEFDPVNQESLKVLTQKLIWSHFELKRKIIQARMCWMDGGRVSMRDYQGSTHM